MKRIVLITSGHPSFNPRLVKEATALLDAGFHVTLIYQYWNNWASKLNPSILNDIRLNLISVGGSPKHGGIVYWYTRIRYKVASIIAKTIGINLIISKFVVGRCAIELQNRAILIKGDLYIAHNLAALPAAVEAAKKNNAKCGFDAEDFHRFENSNDLLNVDVKIRILIENHYLKTLNYLSTSSPFITKAYKELYPQLSPLTILNVFPKQSINIKKEKGSTLKLFWFSQVIGIGRGLETVIQAMCKIKNLDIELHLLGQSHGLIKKELEGLVLKNGVTKKIIFYHDPVNPDKIYELASQFDIGLATEINFPENREICLTNKIFTYIQSNLAVIASDTIAQKWLLTSYPGFGNLFRKGDENDLASLLTLYFSDRQLLYQQQKTANELCKTTLNWDLEKNKYLLQIVNQLEVN